MNRLHLGLFSLALITFGMGTLFLVSDHGLRKKWPGAYDHCIILSLFEFSARQQ
ncbi:MAG: hypothetical protein GY896_18885 [Gammaproteobacteria bacterium]|nr:hypothetical protein [Gammaproteobacteria bacterium]